MHFDKEKSIRDHKDYRVVIPLFDKKAYKNQIPNQLSKQMFT